MALLVTFVATDKSNPPEAKKKNSSRMILRLVALIDVLHLPVDLADGVGGYGDGREGKEAH